MAAFCEGIGLVDHGDGVDGPKNGPKTPSRGITYAKNMSKELGVPLLFDTDVKQYAEMYRHFGCELYNTVTADNGVTRYSLCFK